MNWLVFLTYSTIFVGLYIALLFILLDVLAEHKRQEPSHAELLAFAREERDKAWIKLEDARKRNDSRDLYRASQLLQERQHALLRLETVA